MGQGDLVELVEDPRFHLVVDEFFESGGVGDPAFDVLVDDEGEGVKELGLGEEDEVVVFWEFFEDEAEVTEGIERHEVGIVDCYRPI